MMDQTRALKVHYSAFHVDGRKNKSAEEAASSPAVAMTDQVSAVLEALAADSSSSGGDGKRQQ
jgi:hypothetical protein